MNHTRKSFAIFLFVCVFLGILSPSALERPANAKLEVVQGCGFVPEEGEYLSDSMWSNTDTLRIGVDSGFSYLSSEIVYDLPFMLEKYTISVYFGAFVKPLEFYLRILNDWHYQTGLSCPDEFSAMAIMVMDKRLDIGWFELYCADLSRREGWDQIYPNPFAIIDSNISADNLEGGFDPLGTPGPRPSQSGANAFTPNANAAMMGGTIPIELPKAIYAAAKCAKSKAFEYFINQTAKAGYLKSSFGVPEGCQYFDFSYGGPKSGQEWVNPEGEFFVGGDGCRGVDGFFLEPGSGKCWLLEMKGCSEGGGALGILKGDVVQGSPGWLMRAMRQIKISDVERWDAIKEMAEGKRLRDVCKVVDTVEENAQRYAEELAPGDLVKQKAIVKSLVNFMDRDKVLGLLRKFGTETLGEDIEEVITRVGEFYGEDFIVGIVKKTTAMPVHLDELKPQIVDWAEAFGYKIKDVAGRIRVGNIVEAVEEDL